MYYSTREVDWLLENAGPDRDRSQFAGERRFSSELEGAQVVLRIDGFSRVCDKLHSLRF